jgi:hypothetical protein
MKLIINNHTLTYLHRLVKEMFFPNRFQNKPQDNDHDINEFHGPPPKSQPQEREKEDTLEGQKTEEQALSFLSSSSIINIPRQQRHSAPPQPPLSPHTAPRLFPMSTPPETLRKSFYQIFKPALDELKGDTASEAAEVEKVDEGPGKAPTPPTIEPSAQQKEEKPKEPKDENDGRRTPTPVSMLMLKTEF